MPKQWGDAVSEANRCPNSALTFFTLRREFVSILSMHAVAKGLSVIWNKINHIEGNIETSMNKILTALWFSFWHHKNRSQLCSRHLRGQDTFSESMNTSFSPEN